MKLWKHIDFRTNKKIKFRVNSRAIRVWPKVTIADWSKNRRLVTLNTISGHFNFRYGSITLLNPEKKSRPLKCRDYVVVKRDNYIYFHFFQ